MPTASPTLFAAPIDLDLDECRAESPDAETQWQIDREGDNGEF
jgi:hypothetical protein